MILACDRLRALVSPRPDRANKVDAGAIKFREMNLPKHLMTVPIRGENAAGKGFSSFRDSVKTGVRKQNIDDQDGEHYHEHENERAPADHSF